MKFIPLALACGHMLQDWAWFEMPAEGSGDPSLVECPEGCGLVEYVIEPDPNWEPGGPRQTIGIDLGELNAGYVVEVDFGDEETE